MVVNDFSAIANGSSSFMSKPQADAGRHTVRLVELGKRCIRQQTSVVFERIPPCTFLNYAFDPRVVDPLAGRHPP